MLRAQREGGRRFALALATALTVSVLAPPAGAADPGGTLTRIRDTGKATFGYQPDAAPFSSKDASGNAAGYAVDLCKRIADALKAELKLGTLAVDWVPVAAQDRLATVRDGKVDLSCSANAVTLSARNEVDFSIPIFAGGVGALVRSDSSFRLRQVLEKGQQAGPFWRGSPAQILEQQTFSAVTGTSGASWVSTRLDQLQIAAKVVPVASYDAGVQRVLDRSSSVLFGDRAILLEAARRNPAARDLLVLDRRFTSEPLALTLRRNDDDLRVAVDRVLSRVFASDAFRGVYAKWFGTFDAQTADFFRMSALPE